MNFSGAFRALGYELAAPRIDWSAEHGNGVCLSLWSKEIRYGKDGCSFDSRRDAQPIDTWNTKPGFKRRLGMIERALSEFGGRVDVVIVSGDPGGSFKDAHPWQPEVRKAEWYVTELDPATGHFACETRPVATGR